MKKEFIAGLFSPLFFLPVLSSSAEIISDDSSFVVLDRRLHPDVAISYFDNEGNSPFNGDVRSKIARSREPVDAGSSQSNSLLTFRFTFDVKEGYDHFGGWYFSVKNGSIDFSGKTGLRFELKGSKGIPTSDFQIAVRSSNISPDANRAKIMLSDLGYETFPTDYTTIEIPLTMLLQREPDLDMSHMNDLLIFGFVGPEESIVNQQVWIRNISWTSLPFGLITEEGAITDQDLWIRKPTWSWGLEKTKGGEVANLRMEMFMPDGRELKPDGKALLDELMSGLKSNPDWNLTISGYDAKAEAKTVAGYLIEEGPIDPNKISIQLHGAGSSPKQGRCVEIFIHR